MKSIQLIWASIATMEMQVGYFPGLRINLSRQLPPNQAQILKGVVATQLMLIVPLEKEKA